MKRLLIPLLAVLALPIVVKAEFYSQEEKDRFCNISYDSLNKNRYFRSLWRKECGQNSEVLRNNIKRGLRSEKEQTEKSKSYWLILYFGDNTYGSMEKVEMESAEACNKEGSKWENSSTIERSEIYRSFHCVVGK